jgi:hypothetical protein
LLGSFLYVLPFALLIAPLRRAFELIRGRTEPEDLQS